MSASTCTVSYETISTAVAAVSLSVTLHIKNAFHLGSAAACTRDGTGLPFDCTLLVTLGPNNVFAFHSFPFKTFFDNYI
jgi:hypothetical protein